MKYLYTLFSLLMTMSLSGQKLDSYEFLSSFPASAINFVVAGLDATYDVDLYKVKYYTNDVNGEQHLASGLVCIPRNDGIEKFPMACFQHGTVAGRNDVPSNEAGGHFLPIGFCGYGYVVCSPDYLGLGDSPGIHPYVHAETEASAGVDLLFATRELQDELGEFQLNDQVFISGYSQGGHAAMALHQSLETDYAGEFTVTASAPMSGPYSISDKMVDFTLGDEEYMTVAYLAWLTLGYKTAYPNLLEDIILSEVFKSEYLADIAEFANESIDLWELNDRMIQTLLSTVGSVLPKETLLPNILDALQNDPTHPLSQALKLNDTYNWTATAPTQLIYCVGDDQVTYENAILAEEEMNNNGSTSVEAIRIDTDSNLMDHGQCVIPASLHVLNWFATFQEILSTKDAFTHTSGVEINQKEYTLEIEVSNPQVQQATATIIDFNGQKIQSINLFQGSNIIEIDHLDAGFYLLNVHDNNRLLSTKKLFSF